jgi:hypothetical protein
MLVSGVRYANFQLTALGFVIRNPVSRVTKWGPFSLSAHECSAYSSRFCNVKYPIYEPKTPSLLKFG